MRVGQLSRHVERSRRSQLHAFQTDCRMGMLPNARFLVNCALFESAYLYRCQLHGRSGALANTCRF